MTEWLTCLTANNEIADSKIKKSGFGLERGQNSLVRTTEELLDSEVGNLSKKVDINKYDRV